MSRIYLSPPDVRAPEREMLLAALDSGWVAPVGPDLEAFEAELAERCGVPQVVALSSGTAALHLALLGVGVQPGDDVLVPTLTFAATANAATYCGARPCFIDADPRTWNLCPELLAAELSERRKRNDLPAAVITVDLYGNCADYHTILPLCEDLDIPVIEDAAEALGATWHDQPAGSFGSFGVLSFNGNKLITTSAGGALLCHDEDSANRARYLATQARQPTVHYEHTEVGFNYRLSNLLAAFGRGQLTTLHQRIARRRDIQSLYREALATLPGVRFLSESPGGCGNAWLTCITLEHGEAACSPSDFQLHLERHDIESRPIWKPMHAQSVYRTHPARLNGTAAELFTKGLCLPSGSGMTAHEMEQVIGAAVEILT